METQRETIITLSIISISCFAIFLYPEGTLNAVILETPTVDKHPLGTSFADGEMIFSVCECVRKGLTLLLTNAFTHSRTFPPEPTSF